MRPKYFTNIYNTNDTAMVYAAYNNMSYYWCITQWQPSPALELRAFEIGGLSNDYNQCNLCDIRAAFPGIKAHKREQQQQQQQTTV